MLSAAQSKAIVVFMLLTLASCGKPATTTSIAPLHHTPPLSCGDQAFGHCYATSASALPVQFGSTRFSIAALNVGTMYMIDDEAWLIGSSHECHQACWLEAGYDAESKQFAGGSSYFVEWENEDGDVERVLGPVKSSDIGKTITVTLEINAPRIGEDRITVWVPSLSGPSVYTFPSAMTAGRFQFGQELAGAGSASAAHAVFYGLMVGSRSPGAPLLTHVDTSNDPPFAVWLKKPEDAKAGAQFETRCCNE
jgi:hypothetical protein